MKTYRFALPLLLAGLLCAPCQINAMPAPEDGMAGPAMSGLGMPPHPDMGPGHAPGKRGPRNIFAGMNAEQRAKAMNIAREYDPKIQALREQEFVKMHELNALEHAATPNLEAVRGEARKLLELRRQVRELEREKMDKIRKEVGPIQRPARAPKGEGRHAPAPAN